MRYYKTESEWDGIHGLREVEKQKHFYECIRIRYELDEGRMEVMLRVLAGGRIEY